MEPVDELRANKFERQSPPRSRHRPHQGAAGGSGPSSVSDDWNQSSTLRSPSEGDQPAPNFDHEVASSAALPDREQDQYFGDELGEKRGRQNRNSGFTELSIPDNRTARNSNPSHYTFFRDPTPPPVLLPADGDDEEEERRRHREERARGLGGAALTKEGMMTLPSTSLGGSEHSEDERRGRVCCGASRRVCVVILLALGLLVVAMGLGLGLGLGLKNTVAGQSSGPAAGAGAGGSSSSSTSSALSSSPTRTSSSTSDSSSSTVSAPTQATSSVPRTDCPAANGTTYSPPGLSRVFLRLCGVDYADSGGAVDMVKFPTSNMGECMNACAATSGCTGCSWGIHEGDGGKHPCVLKKELKAAKPMDPDWCFAILQ